MLKDALFYLLFLGAGIIIGVYFLSPASPDNTKLVNDYNQLVSKYNNLAQNYSQLLSQSNVALQNQKRAIPSSPQGSFNSLVLVKNGMGIGYNGVKVFGVYDTKSMEPGISVNHTIIATISFDPNGFKIGQIVSYLPIDSKTEIVHRIIAINSNPEGLCYILQGDNNQVPDKECVKPSQITSLVLGVLFFKNEQVNSCPSGIDAIITNNGISCVDSKLKAGVYPSESKIGESIDYYRFCSSYNKQMPYTIVAPDGRVFCYSNVG
mgnify:CR=1 FL=1